MNQTGWNPPISQFIRVTPPQNGCRLESVFIFNAPVSHPPLSQSNRTFHKSNRPPLHYIPVLPRHWHMSSLLSYCSSQMSAHRFPGVSDSRHRPCKLRVVSLPCKTCPHWTYDQGEPAVGFRWTGWVWDITAEAQDCRKITDHFRGVYRIYPI
jgi:hypothetical protein